MSENTKTREQERAETLELIYVWLKQEMEQNDAAFFTIGEDILIVKLHEESDDERCRRIVRENWTGGDC